MVPAEGLRVIHEKNMEIDTYIHSSFFVHSFFLSFLFSHSLLGYHYISFVTKYADARKDPNQTVSVADDVHHAMQVCTFVCVLSARCVC